MTMQEIRAKYPEPIQSPPIEGVHPPGPHVRNIPGTNTGHGHVWPRPDGLVAKCGGPVVCIECAHDATPPSEEGTAVSDIVYSVDPIHEWFALSYANYLTIPRSVLQSMSLQWQQRFVQCLRELDATIDWRPKDGQYWVRLKDAAGRCVDDLLMNYERGRRHVPPINEPPAAPPGEEVHYG